MSIDIKGAITFAVARTPLWTGFKFRALGAEWGGSSTVRVRISAVLVGNSAA